MYHPVKLTLDYFKFNVVNVAMCYVIITTNTYRNYYYRCVIKTSDYARKQFAHCKHTGILYSASSSDYSARLLHWAIPDNRDIYTPVEEG